MVQVVGESLSLVCCEVQALRCWDYDFVKAPLHKISRQERQAANHPVKLLSYRVLASDVTERVGVPLHLDALQE